LPGNRHGDQSTKGFTTRTTTDEQGVYRLFYLEPATYSLTYQTSDSALLSARISRCARTTLWLWMWSWQSATSSSG
jgi:hypothetical protein